MRRQRLAERGPEDLDRHGTGGFDPGPDAGQVGQGDSRQGADEASYVGKGHVADDDPVRRLGAAHQSTAGSVLRTTCSSSTTGR